MSGVNVTMDVNIILLAIIVILYLGLIAFLSFLGYKKTTSKKDFILGGDNINPYIMALSYGAAFISTSAIVGFGGVAANFGMSLIWLAAANIIFGIFIAFAILGKRVRKIGLSLQAHTFAEFLGKRVDSSFVQVWTGAVLFFTMPLYAAAVLIGASKIIESLLGLPYNISLALFSILVAAYVLLGGLKGIMFVDALQGTLMLLGMLFLLILSYVKLGGVTLAHKELLNMADLVPESLKLLGHRGWTESPKFGSQLWWTIYSSLVLGVGIGVIAQPHLAVRCMTVKSDKDLNRAVLMGSIFILITVGTPYIVGALSNVHFYKATGKIAIDMAGGNPDAIIPLYIKNFMPIWFSYFFMLVILAAAISTLSSQFHAIGIFLSRDVYSTLFKKNNLKTVNSIFISRIGIVIAIIVTIVLAKELKNDIIARATAIFFGITAAGFLSPFLLSLYWKRLTKAGVIAGIMAGLFLSFFGYLFLHQKEAAVFGVSKFLTGKDTLFNGMFSFVDPLVYSFPVSFIFTFFISLFTKVKNSAEIGEFFIKEHKNES